MEQIPLAQVADQLGYALNLSLVFAVVAGMVSLRAWDFLFDLLYQWRAYRRWAAMRRRRLIREARA